MTRRSRRCVAPASLIMVSRVVRRFAAHRGIAYEWKETAESAGIACIGKNELQD